MSSHNSKLCDALPFLWQIAHTIWHFTIDLNEQQSFKINGLLLYTKMLCNQALYY